jgi:hypothetical protein
VFVGGTGALVAIGAVAAIVEVGASVVGDGAADVLVSAAAGAVTAA